MLSDKFGGGCPGFTRSPRSVRIGWVRNRTVRTWFITLVVLAGGLPVKGPCDSAVEPKDLRVLSYNTHGLAGWAARDDPGERLPRIGELLNDYHVALVQEDFAHHRRLRQAATHPIVVRGNGPRISWFQGIGLPCGRCGSGLTLFASEPAERVTRVWREPFSSCSGWIGGGSDCWATKGLLIVQITVRNGATIDFLNLHLDAGDDANDQAARRQQLEHVARTVGIEGADRALIVGGDFNLHYEDPEDRAVLERFRSELRLSDTGAGLSQPETWPEKIDYILYRSGDDTGLELVEAGIAAEFVNGERPLSDHPAIYARFQVRSIAKGGSDVPE
jgi:endonuclease/exonuclease/phosphatase family metal-dependent hydrolase